MTRSLTDRQLGFAAWLSRLAPREESGEPAPPGARARLAALRRGLMLDEDQLFELHGHVPPNFLAGLSSGEERLYLLVAALFAHHPVSFGDEELKERRRNLGESLRLLALARPQSPAPGAEGEPEDLLPEPLKRRMEALLASHQDVFGHLRQMISLLKTEKIPVDWAQLLQHLQEWELHWRPVQWQWSRSFYVGHQDEGGNESHVS